MPMELVKIEVKEVKDTVTIEKYVIVDKTIQTVIEKPSVKYVESENFVEKPVEKTEFRTSIKKIPVINERIVEKIEYKEVPVETTKLKIVEKIVEVPSERTMEKIEFKEKIVEVPYETINLQVVDKIVEKPYNVI